LQRLDPRPSGEVYVTDSTGDRILRSDKAATRLDSWSTSELYADKPGSVTLNGIVHDGKDTVIVNKLSTGDLFRVRIKADGKAAPPVKITTSRPLELPIGSFAGARLGIPANGARVTPLVPTPWHRHRRPRRSLARSRCAPRGRLRLPRPAWYPR
jgi:hypothetical protein